MQIIEICVLGKVTPDKLSKGLCKYLEYGPSISLEVLEAFVSHGADAGVFYTAYWYNWSNDEWRKLITIYNKYGMTPYGYTLGLKWYTTHRPDYYDFAILEAFVDHGANPLARDYKGWNLFEKASSLRHGGWDTQSWLRLIAICGKSCKITPNEFTEALKGYIEYRPNEPIDLNVVKALVNHGANPHVGRNSDGKNLVAIATANFDETWNNDKKSELKKIVDLYDDCIKIKLSPSIPVSRTDITAFDDEFAKLAAVIRQLNKKTNGLFTSEQYHESAKIAGDKLLKNLTQHRKDYREKKITIDEFRTRCGAEIRTALQTELAKQPLIFRALLSFLNFIVGLTVVIPIATKIKTGRWGLFTSEIESEKHLRNIAENLRGLTAEESEPLPEQALAS